MTDVPGVGPAAAKKMSQDGITTAKNLYGLYIMNPEGFKDKLMDSYHMRPTDAQKTYDAMCVWEK